MTMYAPIDYEKVRNLIGEVQFNIQKLRGIVREGREAFVSNRDSYARGEHYFRRALEGILTIGTHILSRLPKTKTKDYQTLITSLGDYGVIPQEFAAKNKKLAAYRNRLVHLYWEVTSGELFTTIEKHLEDIDAFCVYFVEYIRKLEKSGDESTAD